MLYGTHWTLTHTTLSGTSTQAIGSVVFVGATAVGDISGAAFNPAVGLGLSIANQEFEWIYCVAPFCGSVLAYAAFTFTHPDDKFSEKLLGTGEDAPFGSLRLASRQYVTEAIGTMYLVLTIGLTADNDMSGKSATTSLAIGTTLMIMVYAGA